METLPKFDSCLKNYSKENILESVTLITSQVLKIQQIFELNAVEKKTLSDEIELRNLLIEEHTYELAHGLGRCPKIRLNAKWLDKWKFEAGNRVNIIAMPGLLILTPQEMLKDVPHNVK